MLQAINFSASIPIDDYLAMSWGINAVIALGQEFCGSNCRSLSVCFAEKSKDYFLRLHHECFQVLRQMIDSEPWRSIPVNLAELGGILGIIKKNISFNSDCVWGVRSMRGLSLGLMFSVSEDEENFRAKDGSLVLNGKILEMFGVHGNPLHFMTDTKWLVSYHSSIFYFYILLFYFVAGMVELMIQEV